MDKDSGARLDCRNSFTGARHHSRCRTKSPWCWRRETLPSNLESGTFQKLVHFKERKKGFEGRFIFSLGAEMIKFDSFSWKFRNNDDHLIRWCFELILLRLSEGRLYRWNNTFTAENGGQRDAAIEIWLVVREGPYNPWVEDDCLTNIGGNGTNPEICSSFRFNDLVCLAFHVFCAF